MGLVAATAGALAGVVMGGFGYVALNIFAALLVSGVATAAEFARRTSSGTPYDDQAPLAL